MRPPGKFLNSRAHRAPDLPAGKSPPRPLPGTAAAQNSNTNWEAVYTAGRGTPQGDQMAELVAATAQKPLTPEVMNAPMAKVEAACKACHQEFRDY